MTTEGNEKRRTRPTERRRPRTHSKPDVEGGPSVVETIAPSMRLCQVDEGSFVPRVDAKCIDEEAHCASGVSGFEVATSSGDEQVGPGAPRPDVLTRGDRDQRRGHQQDGSHATHHPSVSDRRGSPL
jgi:hypothetical protein